MNFILNLHSKIHIFSKTILTYPLNDKYFGFRREPLNLSQPRIFFGFWHTDVGNCLPGCKVARISRFPATSASGEALSYI